MAEQQVRQVTARSPQRIRDLRVGFRRGLLQAQQPAVHTHRVIAGHFAERLVDRKLYLRVEGVIGGLFSLCVVFGFARQVLARHDFFANTAQVRRKLGIAAIEFTGFRLVFFGQLRFGITLFPVLGFQLFERVGLL